MSNLSYVLLGALMLTPEGLQGGLLHMVYHAIMKICLFSCVGAMMIRTGKSYVGEMRGMSRVMPFTMAVFLFCGIELVGIPPFVGFQSKWALATAALSANGALGVAAVVVLIVSAALTSIYMLAPAVSAYAMPLSPDSGLEGKRLDPGLAHAAAADSAGDRHADSGVCLRAAGRGIWARWRRGLV